MSYLRRVHPALSVAVWTLLVVALLAAPGSEIPDPGLWDWLDKPVHALLFAVHCALLAPALPGRRGGGRWIGAAALGSSLFAGLMETVQLWVPGRSWEWWDLLAGWAGVAVAAAFLARRRARLRRAS